MLVASSPALYLATGSILLFLVIFIPVFILLKEDPFPKAKNSLGLYTIVVIITAIYYRLPFFSLAEVNPDESQEIAAALTLLHDPVYWRSVDLHTHGPLSTYPLMLPHLLGMQIDYGSTRLIGLAMLLTSTLLIFLMLRKSTVNTVATVAVLPIITFICMTDYWDFIAYNAEHPAIFTVVLALYFTDKALQSENKFIARHLYLSGFIIGCGPFVKIQCLPMLLVIATSTYVIIWLKHESTRYRLKLVSIYSLGCLTFAALLFSGLWHFDLFDDFVMRYLYGQMNYANNTFSATKKITLFIETFDWVNLSAWYYFGLLIFADIVLAGYIIIFKTGAFTFPRQDNNHKTTFLTDEMSQLSVFLMVTAMSLVAIYIPGRPYRHYFLLLAFPLGLLTGKLFILTYKSIDKQKTRIWFAVMFVLVTAFGQYYYKYLFSSYNVLLLKNKLSYELLTVNSNIFNTSAIMNNDKLITDAINKYASPGEKMVVWGWANKHHVNTKLIVGCRTASVQILTKQFGNSSYYFDSFMQELEAAKASIFLDTVAPDQFVFTEKTKHGFEKFPRLNKFIQDHYICMDDINGVRIFVSKQRIAERQKHSVLNKSGKEEVSIPP